MGAEPETVELRGFGLANYRSFDNVGFIIKNLKRVNVFIGKNNCGKSNVLRTIELLRQVKGASHSIKNWDATIDSHRQDGRTPVVTACVPVDGLFKQEDLDRSQVVREGRKALGETFE